MLTVYVPNPGPDAVTKDALRVDAQWSINLISRSGLEATTRPPCQHCPSRSGQMSVKMVACLNPLVIASTGLYHPKRHLLTWRSNDFHTKAHINNILVCARWPSSVLDCRAFRAADVGSVHGLDGYTQQHTTAKTCAALLDKRCRVQRAHPPLRLAAGQVVGCIGQIFQLRQVLELSVLSTSRRHLIQFTMGDCYRACSSVQLGLDVLVFVVHLTAAAQVELTGHRHAASAPRS